MTPQEIPCCGNCPTYPCQRIIDASSTISSKSLEDAMRGIATNLIATTGCLHHPNARAYLMKGVIEELEKEQKCQLTLIGMTRGHHNEIHNSIYNTFDYAISLIKRGVK